MGMKMYGAKLGYDNDNNIDAATNHIDADNMNSALSRYNLIYLIL
jgi:hypothetical protein